MSSCYPVTIVGHYGIQNYSFWKQGEMETRLNIICVLLLEYEKNHMLIFHSILRIYAHILFHILGALIPKMQQDI